MKRIVGSFFFFISICYQAHGVIKPIGLEKQQYLFHLCKQNSLKLAAPHERDRARMNCLVNNFSSQGDLKTCIKEAKKFEYLVNEQEGLKNCYYGNSRFSGIKNCLIVAKELHTLSDRDDMRLSCISSLGLPNNKGSCLEVVDSFEQGQVKKKLRSICLEN